MFRPMMIMGILAVVLGISSYMMVPGWRNSPLGLLMIIFLIALGGYAFVRDGLSYYNELKHEIKGEENNKPNDNPPADGA